jgi:hypothetical protein
MSICEIRIFSFRFASARQGNSFAGLRHFCNDCSRVRCRFEDETVWLIQALVLRYIAHCWSG